MNVWLLLSGDYAAPAIYPAADDVVIAVDGGMAHATKLGVTPSLWIGDFDSTSDELAHDYQHVPRQIFPKRKDDTDLALALKYVRDTLIEVDTLHLIGAFGDEFDHVFANFWLLPQFQQPTIAWGRNNHAIYLPAQCHLTLTGQVSDIISVFALTHLSGVTYRGLEWPLQDAAIAPFTAVSARNALATANASIYWLQGDGLVIVDANVAPTIVANTLTMVADARNC